RLDENTGPDNFLRHAFKISVGSPEWNRLETGFLEALALVPKVNVAPLRTQDRREAPVPEQAIAHGWQHFINEPDTDFALPQNGLWAEELSKQWKPRCDERAT